MQIEENVGGPLKSSLTVILNHAQFELRKKIIVISKKVLIYYVLI